MHIACAEGSSNDCISEQAKVKFAEGWAACGFLIASSAQPVLQAQNRPTRPSFQFSVVSVTLQASKCFRSKRLWGGEGLDANGVLPSCRRYSFKLGSCEQRGVAQKLGRNMPLSKPNRCLRSGTGKVQLVDQVFYQEVFLYVISFRNPVSALFANDWRYWDESPKFSQVHHGAIDLKRYPRFQICGNSLFWTPTWMRKARRKNF